jgi:hypothetical protein
MTSRLRPGLAALLILTLLPLAGCSTAKTELTVGENVVLASELDGYAPDRAGDIFLLVPVEWGNISGMADEITDVQVEYDGDLWQADATAMGLLADNDAYFDLGEQHATLVFQIPPEVVGDATVIGSMWEVEGGGPTFQQSITPADPAVPEPVDGPRIPRVELGETATIGDLTLRVDSTRLVDSVGGVRPADAAHFLVAKITADWNGADDLNASSDNYLRFVSLTGDEYPNYGLELSDRAVSLMAAETNELLSDAPVESGGSVSGTLVFPVDGDGYLALTDPESRRTIRFDAGLGTLEVGPDIPPLAAPVPLGESATCQGLEYRVVSPVSLDEEGVVRVDAAVTNHNEVAATATARLIDENGVLRETAATYMRESAFSKKIEPGATVEDRFSFIPRTAKEGLDGTQLLLVNCGSTPAIWMSLGS